MTETAGMYQVWVDTGGTFTDGVALTPDGNVRQAKVLSSGTLRGVLVAHSGPTFTIRQSWNAPVDFIRGLCLSFSGAETAPVTAFDPDTGIVTLAAPLAGLIAPGTPFEVRFGEEAPVVACRLLTQTPAHKPLPPLSLRLATTRGTNALLTRSGVPPVFFVTEGFGDLLEIGTQQRPDLFALDIEKPAPLYGATVEVRERLAADGSVLRALDTEHVRREAERLIQAGHRTASVTLLHSYCNPAHELRAAEILREAGFTHVSLSSQLSPFIKAVPRAQTSVVNAYLAPIIHQYLSGVRQCLPPDTSLHVMTSAGGLVGADAFAPKDSLLSGPAGGIVGAARAGQQAGFDRIIAFDMGGTSTDVARFDGTFDYVREHTVGQAHLVAPALAIESVAAGGGTVCTLGPHGARVGPDSAGASPGPACYGVGGPLTLTDVNLLLGRIVPSRFEIPLFADRSENAARLVVGDASLDRDALLEGFLDIANERMAGAIRRISVRQGYDPAGYALVSFGGAGGQHACAVAERLGMTSIVVPPDASLLSAWGIGHAAIERFAERQVLRVLDGDAPTDVAALFADAERDAIRAVVEEGIAPEQVTVKRRIANVRLIGQETAQSVEYDPAVPLEDLFAQRFALVFGYPPPPGRAVEVESLRVVAGGPPGQEMPVEAAPQIAGEPITVRARFAGRWRTVPAWERAGLGAEQTLIGPGLVVEPHSVLVVESGWQCQRHSSGALVLTQTAPSTPLPAPASVRLDAVEEELFAARFAAIAEEMGEQLRQNSISTNVKERLDFSCALLDADGQLVATAAHIPVHLGALGVCVRRLREFMVMEPGDVIVTNHPGWGGSHLPDVTVVTPVYDDHAVLIGYVASRAHHAEIGGTRPGSMPPGATTLAEEGVVLAPMHLMQRGQSHLDAVCERLISGPYPSRALADNRADLEAALAAGRRGADALAHLADRHGRETVRQQMLLLTQRAETLLRQTLRALPDGEVRATEYLDDGTPIAVKITIAGETAKIDFTGHRRDTWGKLERPARRECKRGFVCFAAAGRSIAAAERRLAASGHPASATRYPRQPDL